MSSHRQLATPSERLLSSAAERVFSPPGRNRIRRDLRSTWCFRQVGSAAPPNIWKLKIPRLGLKRNAKRLSIPCPGWVGACPKGSQLLIASDHEFVFVMILSPWGLCAAAPCLTLPQSPSGRHKVILPIRAKHPLQLQGRFPSCSSLGNEGGL